MRMMLDVPDRVADDALRAYRTPRQQAEYLIARALRCAGCNPEDDASKQQQVMPAPNGQLAGAD